MAEVYDVLILGSGPGGLNAALYSARYTRKTCLITGSWGGLVAKSGKIENWLGVPVTDGVELAEVFKKHVAEYDVDVVEQYATAVKKENGIFTISYDGGEVQGKTIIFALGTKNRELEIPGEKELTGRGVSYCATCDGMFFKQKDVVIIGGSDSAAKAALYLADLAKTVKILYRGQELRCEGIYKQRIEANPKIEVIYDTIPTAITGENKVESIKIKTKDIESQIKADGIFVTIGLLPLKELPEMLGIKMDEGGFVITSKDTKTNVEAAYAIGDMTNVEIRQIATAVGEGAVAANAAHEYIQKN
ncbi:MAG: thioredoxin-disulfide reductase [Patescibacteria group bacterium]|jgi:thioredoxin-disulfide reductase